MNKEGNQTKKKSNDKKSQLTVGLLLGLVILGLIIFLVIAPSWNSITLKKAEIEANQVQLNRLQNKITALAQARENYQQISDQIAIIDEAIPDYSNPPMVMKMLEKLAGEIVDDGGPLVIVSKSIPVMPNDTPEATRSTGAKELNEVKVAVNLLGDYQAVRDYILKIKALRHNFYVEKITFSAPQDDNRQGFLDVVLNLKYDYFN